MIKIASPKKHLGILKLFFSLFIFFVFNVINAQDLSQLAIINVDDLSDQQIQEVWQKAQSSGYSIEQLSVMAQAQGMSPTEIDKLITRINLLPNNYAASQVKNKVVEVDEVTKDAPTFGINGGIESETKKSNPLFGYDFFNNPNITFTPNINVATPQNYRLGPGDVIGIDVWGAVEATYSKKISKEGFIQIAGLGQINLSGMTLKDATNKINSNLKKIYYGINAPEGSYSKVFTNIVLESIRTVQVNIIGEVKVPGTYSLSGLSTVLNALYAAGGPTEEGTFREIKVVRDGQTLDYFDFYKYLLNGSEKGNVQLQDQDVIIVSPYLSHITIEGQVKRPGIYEVKNDESFRDLLNFSSGFTPKAYKKSILVERYTDTKREIKEFKLDDNQLFKLKNGDNIIVKEILNLFENRVSIEGAVFHPGNYEFYEGMTVGDLLQKAEGVRDEANFDKALIIRRIDEKDKEVISFSLEDVLNGKSNPELKKDDTIHVYTKSDLRDERYISINGAINKPIKINYMEGLTVQDFIALAGGFKEGADPNNIEIARRLSDEDFSTVAQIIRVAVNPNLNTNDIENSLIKPFDVVTVRYKKGFSVQKNVTITGEVQFPGTYTLQNEEETIYDLVTRAGGFTPYAYLPGATLQRIKKDDTSQREVENYVVKNDTLLNNIAVGIKTFKIGINLPKIMLNKNANYNITLEENDHLIIPKINETIEVQGKVFTPSLVPYLPGKDIKYYVNNSGGFLSKAKKSKVFVVYPNGEIATTKRFLFFRSYPDLEPGATILVPEKEDVKPLLTTDQIVGLTSGFAGLIILLDRLIK